MKKYSYLLFFCCLFFSVDLNAQNNPTSAVARDRIFNGPPSPITYLLDFNPISNYHFFNPFAFNPAMAGIGDKRQINGNWNRQIEHSPSASYEQPLASINSAIGINYAYSKRNFGRIHRYGLAYNYGFRWKENTQLRIGVQFSQINISTNDFSLLSLGENEWTNFPSLDFGLAFQFKQLRLGASVQNLVPKKFPLAFTPFGSSNSWIETNRKLNLSAANTFKLSKKWDWSLAFLLRFSTEKNLDDYYYYSSFYYGDEGKQQQHDFSTYLSFDKKYSIGATYRTQYYDPVWIGFVGFKIKEKLNLQFSFNAQKSEYDPRFWEALAQYQF